MEEPTVSIAARPVAGAVQRYQTEVAVPERFQWTGSPASPVALTLVPAIVPVRPVTTVALAKLSLGGGVGTARIPTDASRLPPLDVMRTT